MRHQPSPDCPTIVVEFRSPVKSREIEIEQRPSMQRQQWTRH
jgi:hypothetical protein